MKKILYAVSLIIAIAMFLLLWMFPVLEFDREAIYENHKEEIEQMIKESENLNMTTDDLKEDAIDSIIYDTCITLRMYSSSNIEEGDNIIDSNYVNEAIMEDLFVIKQNGIKFIDLCNSVKNTITYDVKVYQLIKETSGSVKLSDYFIVWINPLLILCIVLMISVEFACSILVAIRSIKGINEQKRNKLLIISIIGAAFSNLLLVIPFLFRKEIALENMDKVSDFVRVFLMNVRCTNIIYYCGIGFAFCIGISLFAKFFRYSKKNK